MKRAYKRLFRNYLIYPKFQLSLISAQALIVLLTFLIVEWENNQAFAHLRMLGIESGLPKEHAYFQFIDTQAHAFLLNTLVAIGITLIISSAATLYFSFKIAGPIYRLRAYLREANRDLENIKPLSFRNGDYYGDIPPLINNVIQQAQIQRGHFAEKNRRAS